MRSQKEWVVPQRHFRMPAKKVVKPEQTEEERLGEVSSPMLSWSRCSRRSERNSSPRIGCMLGVKQLRCRIVSRVRALGHASITNTVRYTAMSPERFKLVPVRERPRALRAAISFGKSVKCQTVPNLDFPHTPQPCRKPSLRVQKSH